MDYTVKQIADLSGVSARTLRYYDQINLLKPKMVNDSGYRIYGEEEINRLQQILLYRSMGMKLEQIQSVLDDSTFDIHIALEEHRKQLLAKRKQIDHLLLTVDKTIRYQKGELNMSNNEKFEGFKKEQLEENEKMFGDEIRQKYGEEAVNASNQQWMNMSEKDFKKMQEIEDELFMTLDQLDQSKDLDSKEAQQAFDLHKNWLLYSWSEYSAEAHKGLAEMYAADDRFRKYYNDKAGKEIVDLLRDVIVKYANQQ
ncbi:MerR family transcriptional regulator [Oceanobacillus iheyensis]|uniref:Transcriptional activator of multidrug-efflux transporter genes n=1 Tax=Oceanobacillus iheyensis (strain DSM 14371 / CIP 107618 / JCM 11309 / KCTC 3954 / HTE831) TaxID=221109 RepID=Q8ET80_OCEIH|nr:MerR family transcriptional regulator [Oceanobacillus iheyensis]BAC12338.1 transcriptional activator of multidrug-efflux transporter genes [Oceanobacillus iheyensis HTE831]